MCMLFKYVGMAYKVLVGDVHVFHLLGLLLEHLLILQSHLLLQIVVCKQAFALRFCILFCLVTLKSIQVNLFVCFYLCC